MTLTRGRIALAGHQISLQVDRLSGQSIASAGLTGAQARALLYILRHPDDTSVTVLHRITGHSKAAISRLIKQLREKGYICVQPWEGDERRRLLVGTEKAKVLRTFLETAFQSVEEVLYRGFSHRDLRDLNRLQQKMIRNLSAYQTDAQREASAT